MKITSYIVILFILVMSFSSTSCVKKESEKEAPAAAEKTEAKESSAPQKAAKGPMYKNLVDGQDISLEGLKGHVLLIDFWATWCPPCRVEIPGFIELYDKYKDKKFTIVGISLDNGESVVKKFVERQKINYPIIMSTNKLRREYENAIGRPIQSIPTTILINRQGEVATVYIGARPKEVFDEEIQKLLEEG